MIYIHDERFPASPWHPRLPEPCAHNLSIPHMKARYANDPESLGGTLCSDDAPRIEGTQTVAFEELEPKPPQMELF